MQPLKEHLIERGLLDWHSNYYIIEEEDLVIFLLSDFMGKITGIQNYRRFGGKLHQSKYTKENYDKMKYWTVKPRATEAIWGYDSLHLSPEIYLVEGIFDAMVLHRLGKSCLALLGCNPKDCKNSLSLIRRELITICDGDDAGGQLAEYADSAIYLPIGEDVNSIVSYRLTHYLALHKLGVNFYYELLPQGVMDYIKFFYDIGFDKFNQDDIDNFKEYAYNMLNMQNKEYSQEEIDLIFE